MDFPYTITIIMNDAFSIAGTEKQGITSLALPATLEVIGNGAFSNNKKIVGVLVIPASLKSIGQEAFKGCEGITGIDFMEATVLKTIEDGVFLGCKGITGTVTLPASVETLGSEAFKECLLIEKTDISAATKLTSINSYLFNGCATLTEVVMPSSILLIGQEAFANCSKLVGLLTLPEGLTTIAPSAFNNCAVLDTLSLPASVVTIGNYAFKDCPKLTSITTLGDTEPIIGSDAFANVPAVGRELNVPNATEGFGTDTDNKWGAHKINYKQPGGVINPFDNSTGHIFGAQGSISLIDFVSGTTYSIYTLIGATVATGTTDATHSTVDLPAGIYVVKVAHQTAKVIVTP